MLSLSTTLLHRTLVLVSHFIMNAKSILKPSGKASDLILKRAKAVEATVLSDFKNDTGREYKGKIRSLFLNLKDKNNPGLRAAVVSGDLSVGKFCRMSSSVRDYFGMHANSLIPLIDNRKWRLRNENSQTKLSWKRIFTNRLERVNGRQKRMPSSAASVSRGKQGIVRLRREALMNL